MADTTLPHDLVTIRQAADLACVEDQSIYRWIRAGKGGKKLATYRAPGKAEIMLVSQAAVISFRDKKIATSRRLGHGSINIQLGEEDANEVRKLCVLMSARVKVPLGYAQVVRSAVDYAMRLEQARAKASKEDESDE